MPYEATPETVEEALETCIEDCDDAEADVRFALDDLSLMPECTQISDAAANIDSAIQALLTATRKLKALRTAIKPFLQKTTP